MQRERRQGGRGEDDAGSGGEVGVPGQEVGDCGRRGQVGARSGRLAWAAAAAMSVMA